MYYILLTLFQPFFFFSIIQPFITVKNDPFQCFPVQTVQSPHTSVGTLFCDIKIVRNVTANIVLSYQLRCHITLSHLRLKNFVLQMWYSTVKYTNFYLDLFVSFLDK